MFAERVHVVEMNARDKCQGYNAQMAEKKKANHNSEILERGGETHAQRPYDRYANTSVTVRRLSRLCEGRATVRDCEPPLSPSLSSRMLSSDIRAARIPSVRLRVSRSVSEPESGDRT